LAERLTQISRKFHWCPVLSSFGASPSSAIINQPALMEYKFLCFFGVLKNEIALFMKAPAKNAVFPHFL
jgi:hypothetical protein